jgi:nucleotide-binding universal stress UspA family protein
MEVMKSASLNFLGKTRIHLVDPNVQIMVEEGEVAETILRTAKKIHADIVVIGSHSRKWLENIVMGSVSGEVLNHTTIPVQIIPTKKHN